ncbi:MAG: hypothetical protein E7354_04905 [Clostridiales bacterium]|nr:hypothetical protein [Clostridiales bacterium]
MSIITGLEVQKKNETRANLYLDDEFYAGVSIETCIKNHLKKGVEIDKEQLDMIILEDEKTVAMSKAVKYMGGALKTAKQIRDYLKKKEFAPNTIEYVLEKMKEYRYLDDENYARSFVLTYSSKYGKLKLKSMLKSRGVSDKIMDQILDGECEPEDSLEKVAEKYLKNKIIDEKNLVKLARFLCSRGYEFDKINNYISRLRKGE